MTTVAVVGLGAMGRRIARRLVDAGHDLHVWNRTPAKADDLAAAGALVAGSPAEAAAAAEVVVTMVADPGALAAVTEGADGIAAGATPGTDVLEMSTVGPRAIQRLRSVLPPEVTLLDAPVLGSLTEVENGTLRAFVGGDRAAFDRVRPLLESLGEPMHAGPLGAGAAAKLVANSTLFGVLGVLGEAIQLADSLGLDRATTFGVLSATPVGASGPPARRARERRVPAAVRARPRAQGRGPDRGRRARGRRRPAPGGGGASLARGSRSGGAGGVGLLARARAHRGPDTSYYVGVGA